MRFMIVNIDLDTKATLSTHYYIYNVYPTNFQTHSCSDLMLQNKIDLQLPLNVVLRNEHVLLRRGGLPQHDLNILPQHVTGAHTQLIEGGSVLN